MIYPIFHVPLFQTEVSDWEIKKQKFLELIDDKNFYRELNSNFHTDRSNNTYAGKFQNIFYKELVSFLRESSLSEIKEVDVWTVKYSGIGDFHCPHNHGSTGFSGALYLEYDPNVHESTKFVSPWNNPVTDRTQISSISNAMSGVMYIWPSFLLHYTDSLTSNVPRTVVSWDMKVQ
jgi:hypothetical protein